MWVYVFNMDVNFFLLFADIDEEAKDSRVEVKTFDKSKLKHVDTKEENTLPGAGGETSNFSVSYLN